MGFSAVIIVSNAAPVKLCAEGAGAFVALRPTRSRSVDTYSQPLLDAVDHLCHQVDGDPEIEVMNNPHEFHNFRRMMITHLYQQYVVEWDSDDDL